MTQVNDIVNYNGIELTCWLIETIEGETYAHLLNVDGTIGVCVIENEIN